VAPTLSAVAQDLTIAPVTPDQGEAAVAGPPLPEVARERYEVMGTFARGGVGKIVRAREPHLERTVALKELRRGSDPDSRERFIREARLTARLQHPSIVPVYDAGLWPDGDPFFSMKLVSGRSLARVLREAETLADRLALLPHVLAVAEAIAYAHSQRIIHRDLKPGNILIGEFGETVVIDWGLAKDLDQAVPEDSLPAAAARGPSLSASRSSGESEQGLTLTGMIMGTPAYMPPEQAIGIPVDERADVYALGAILYHLLTGQPPYQGEDSVEVLRQVTLGPPPPISRIARGVSEELRAIVDKAMARRPEQRYPSAREFAEDLRRYQTGKIVGAHRYTTYERLIRFARRYRTPLAALVVLAISGAVAFVEIVEEKRVAEEQRAAAQAAQAEAERERRLADAHADDLTLEQARLAVHSDPGRALQLLARLSPQFNEWNAARVIASDARAQGLATVLRGHTATVNAVAFSRDGASLYTSSDDRTIRRSNAFTGALERVYSGHEDEVWGIAVAPDGATLASGSKDKTVRLWDVETGEARVLRGHTQGVFNVVFAGEFVFSFSHDRLVRLWDPSTGELRDTFDVRDAPERQFAFVGLGQSGRALIHEGEGGAMFMTDIYTRAQVRFDPGGVLTGASLSADGRRVAATTDDGRMHLWSDDGASLPIPGYTGEGKASRVSLTPDGAMILYADDRGFIVLRDLESGESREFVVDRRMAGGFRLSPDGEWLAAPLSDGTLHLIGVR
ncbi:MAG: serine/threonine-protein kinase, partial [Nannocystaceae bacterium]